MKGVGSNSIKYAAIQESEKLGQPCTGLDLYKRMFDGETLSFDLCVNDELNH